MRTYLIFFTAYGLILLALSNFLTAIFFDYQYMSVNEIIATLFGAIIILSIGIKGIKKCK